jgi:Rieske Fe-S protein
MTAADTPDLPEESETLGPDRRAALRGMSAMGLAAFAIPFAARPQADDPVTSLIKTLTGGGSEPAEPTPTPAPAPKPPTKVQSVEPKGKFVKASKTPMGSVEDVPVEGGVLFESDQYVVTQPKAGHFVGFDALCTHEGCPVDVFDKPGVMSCSCHSTDFDITTGKVLAGPAKKPMPKKPIII